MTSVIPEASTATPTPTEQRQRPTADLITERLTWPRVILEQQPLDEGTPVMYRDMGDGRWRLAWDPAQTTRAHVEVIIKLHVAGSGEYHEISPDTDRDLRRLESHRRSDDTPAMVAMWNEIVDQILTHNDAQGVIAQVADIMRAELDRKAAGQVTA